MTEKWQIALASYRMGGQEFSVSFQATSMADAAARVKAMRGNLSLDGWPAYQVPASMGWLAKLWCWLANGWGTR